MKFRNLIFVLAIAFSVIFASMIGTSYAYYVATGGTTITATTGNIDTGVAVVFNQSQYINVSSGVPISEADVDNLASASVFTLTPNKDILSGADVAVNVSIIDISIDSTLKVSDFRYKLSCSNGTTSIDLGSGSGIDFTDDVISSGILNLGTLSTTDNTFNVNNTYTCTLRVWLQETNADQNTLMGKKFSGLIKVNTLFKK